mmetsp:Transcript_12949/g.29836  ORF Transcript_12949/g.29836 Transcript_12949/m.29836 type:complete len:213 (+) Transcript_12949:681-1319(+)
MVLSLKPPASSTATTSASTRSINSGSRTHCSSTHEAVAWVLAMVPKVNPTQSPAIQSSGISSPSTLVRIRTDMKSRSSALSFAALRLCTSSLAIWRRSARMALPSFRIFELKGFLDVATRASSKSPNLFKKDLAHQRLDPKRICMEGARTRLRSVSASSPPPSAPKVSSHWRRISAFIAGQNVGTFGTTSRFSAMVPGCAISGPVSPTGTSA